MAPFKKKGTRKSTKQVKCQHCGISRDAKGMASHEKACQARKNRTTNESAAFETLLNARIGLQIGESVSKCGFCFCGASWTVPVDNTCQCPTQVPQDLINVKKALAHCSRHCCPCSGAQSNHFLPKTVEILVSSVRRSDYL